MESGKLHNSRPHTLRFLTSLLAVVCVSTSLHAGLNNNGGQAVGGVLINPEGVVRNATIDEQRELANVARAAHQDPIGALTEATDMRMISLVGIQKALQECHDAGTPIPSDLVYMAGMTRIQYVFVDTDRNDIILAGPAEPWEMQQDGSVVGTVSGKSTMRLADLIVALRTVEDARREGISCSIEPTAEGRLNLRQMLRRVKLRPGQNPAIFEAQLKEAFGPQMILLSGVPKDCRYARILVAADYDMKRVALALTPSNVRGLPSYLEMSQNSRHSATQNPRWWMACNYEAMVKSEDALAWKLTGQGVKTLTEQDVIAADGTVEGAGRSDKIATKWAETMTDKYTELAKQMPVFGDLQSIMDMTVVATLISQEQLDVKAGIDMSTLQQQTDVVNLTSYAVPQSVDPQCSFIRGRSGWVVTASGGVDVNAFDVVRNQTVDAKVADTRQTALASAGERWWWNK
ncbi:hypothetical protein CA13_53130 [Planctomycetes bacterium CA13]|uniref:DUF1598 domain-containing protein n=1 Tax=Novipirellula herctigrandis TaxID=2527986 RepID=A0A5C5Z9G2_9BACT|nr:hypothetical protein CA13_53130 [Planctomycetes bacterium CA13]